MLVNCRPAGAYLMEDFYYAGGLPALWSVLSPLLHGDARTVGGPTVGEIAAKAEVHDADVIRSLDTPVSGESGLAVLYGNLAPNGAVIKPAAADPRLKRHTGPALVFDDYPHMKREIDRDDLDVTPDHVLILRNVGPLGGPGMPEWGMLPIPKKLLKQGVRDMLRISDARMSGTELRGVHPACRAGILRRWTSGIGPDGRHDLGRYRGANAECRDFGRGNGTSSRCLDPAGAALRARLRLDDGPARAAG